MSTQFIVMGVSGSGKSTVGRMLAETWGVPFIEGDTLHSEVSVAKMAAGIPLDDADRLPWLDRIGEAVAAAAASGRGAVVSCSALKLAYRDRLRVAAGPHLRFAMLDLRREVLETRMGERKGHYMPPRFSTASYARWKDRKARPTCLLSMVKPRLPISPTPSAGGGWIC